MVLISLGSMIASEKVRSLKRFDELHFDQQHIYIKEPSLSN